jgi:hypothetical protein
MKKLQALADGAALARLRYAYVFTSLAERDGVGHLFTLMSPDSGYA